MDRSRPALTEIENWLQSSANSGRPDKPQVILSFALSLDGSLSTGSGRPTSISCNESMKFVHYIRAYCDAIMVGIGTILSDNPRLSVRLVEGNNPVPVILDSKLRTPPAANALGGRRHPIIFCGPDTDEEKKLSLEKAGALILSAGLKDEGLSFPGVLKNLYARGIRLLMVEGGAGILRSFLASGLWDKMAVTVSPMFLGGYNLLASSTLGTPLRAGASRWLEAGRDRICLIDKETP